MKKPHHIRARNFPSAQDEVKAAKPHSPYDAPGSSFVVMLPGVDG